MIALDLPPLVAGFGRRLHDAGLPVTPERAARFAEALKLTNPVARTRLYWIARATLLSDISQRPAFDRVFAEVFGTRAPEVQAPEGEAREASDDARPGTPREGESGIGAPGAGRGEREVESQEAPVPVLASDEELLRSKRFDALEPDELAALYRLMTRLEIATPKRRTRRSQKARRGEHIDLRRTLRGSLRTGGHPIRLARKRRRIQPRRIVMLCDISGSMEPYSRAYLQFLTIAGHDAEAFVFATRLTRITRALATKSPERAIRRAAAAAPDWSSGTRIGEALRTFNDRHGRRGMARGAVIVILSDGWERGEPELVGREMERLSRLAYRIIWVNPRVSAANFVPRAGGMAAALPHCDALVSGHSLDALAEVIDAIGAERGGEPPPVPEPEEEEEPWASATPQPGSSVAMPSGYGPARGRTTPGW
ncbi:MAG TPA: VWA domain-containing protein [Solirubrobacter sp.]|nr:VWA domain-containing protein [Solirubrobacter sp.]